jgi:hypothetical protein
LKCKNVPGEILDGGFTFNRRSAGANQNKFRCDVLIDITMENKRCKPQPMHMDAGVLIVGFGPSGSYLANTLGQYFSDIRTGDTDSGVGAVSVIVVDSKQEDKIWDLSYDTLDGNSVRRLRRLGICGNEYIKAHTKVNKCAML